VRVLRSQCCGARMCQIELGISYFGYALDCNWETINRLIPGS
jgi:hypothetical protein